MLSLEVVTSSCSYACVERLRLLFPLMRKVDYVCVWFSLAGDAFPDVEYGQLLGLQKLSLGGNDITGTFYDSTI